MDRWRERWQTQRFLNELTFGLFYLAAVWIVVFFVKGNAAKTLPVAGVFAVLGVVMLFRAKAYARTHARRRDDA